MDKIEKISKLSLQIQFSATAVASSLVLIFVPNFETISFTAFLFGFLFPIKMAIYGTIIMTLTWEIVASMIFGFSGIIFPFKIIAWIIIMLLGVLGRRLKIKHPGEFAFFGVISAIIFDLIVSISNVLIFINDSLSFITAFVSFLIIGLVFTISHFTFNFVIFSLMPKVFKVIVPLIIDNYGELCLINEKYFEGVNDDPEENYKNILFGIGKFRFSIYMISSLLLIFLLIFTGVSYYENVNERETENIKEISLSISISYSDLRVNDTFELIIYNNYSALNILEEVSILNYTNQFGIPYIQAINNVWENLNISNHYWIFYLNDLKIDRGVSLLYFNDGDIFLCSYENY